MEYRGYKALVKYDYKNRILVGMLEGTNIYTEFEGKSVDELEQQFHFMVDKYLEDCARAGTKPEKSYSGVFNLRIPPKVHERLAFVAHFQGCSLNELIKKILEESLK